MFMMWASFFLIHFTPFPRTIGYQRGDYPLSDSPNYSVNTRTGFFDSDGNFVPEIDSSLRSHHLYVSRLGNEPVLINNWPLCNSGYMLGGENRGNAFLAGTWGGKTDWLYFIPESGSRVLSRAEALRAANKDRLIYNYTHHTHIFPKQSLPKKQSRQQTTPPPLIGPPPGWELVSFRAYDPRQYPTSDRWFIRVIQGVCEFGHLHSSGEFVPDYGLPVMKYSKTRDPSEFSFWAPPKEQQWDLLRTKNFYPNYTYTLPLYGEKSEPCFEYRSGRLIKGILHDTGNFAPEIGSKVIPFTDYKPETDLRIYNLPGVLR
ncbi:MAG: hypothetical protein ACRCZF_05655, partial [Gemmataceae bacterium]